MDDKDKHKTFKEWMYIVNHVFLPAQLPQEDDFGIAQEHALCAVIEDCALEYAVQARSQRKRRWNRMHNMVGNLKKSHDTVSLTSEHVNDSLSEMKELGKVFVSCYHPSR